jgi:alcohol dehydrogenase (cytochrome c)
MAPGYNHGTVYVSTVPVNPDKGEYPGGAKSALRALNAATGAPEWSWDEVQNLRGNPGLNSGGGLRDPPSFDSAGNLYIAIANPGPIGQGRWPKGFPLATSRPGPDLYTDSVVKLSPAGKLPWYYQLTPHDLFDWDLQNSPVLTTAGGQQVVIDGGKAGILIELNAKTGKLIWKLPAGVHRGPANAGLRTEHATPATATSLLPAKFTLEPGVFGGIESQLATNGTTTFAAVNNLGVPMSVDGVTESSKAFEAAIPKAAGEMVAVNQATGKIKWDDKLPSSPYGAATITNNVVFTTTYSGHLYAFNTATGAILLNTPLSAGSNAPLTIDGDYVIAGAAVPLSGQALIIAYKLGAHGKLPRTVH